MDERKTLSSVGILSAQKHKQTVYGGPNSVPYGYE